MFQGTRWPAYEGENVPEFNNDGDGEGSWRVLLEDAGQWYRRHSGERRGRTAEQNGQVIYGWTETKLCEKLWDVFTLLCIDRGRSKETIF